MTDPFVKKTYYAMTLDPVHIGTGGYRLGRVDNTITREPGTNIPKIPGSSISGATRAYTAMTVQNENFEVPENTAEGWVVDYKKYKKWKYQQPDYAFMENGVGIKYSSGGKAIIKPNIGGPAVKKDKNGRDIYLSCAGKGADEGEGHCGNPDCEVCVSFGFSKKGNSFQGLAQFFDARILFFPVHSMIGPVWITSPSILNDFKEAIKSNGTSFEFENKLDNDKLIQTDLIDANKTLNLGWLLLVNKEKCHPVKSPNSLGLSADLVKKIVMVSDKYFSRIVNDNLEVRTSVAIDPATGAAEEGALYTYEAIPRATVMWFDVVYNSPEYFRIRQNGIDQTIQHGKTAGEGWRWIQENVEKGLPLMEHMGVGGMNTRGMGRIKVVNIGG